MIKKFKKIVIKIGSSTIIDGKKGIIKIKWLNSICKDIKKLADGLVEAVQEFNLFSNRATSLG